MWRWKQKHGRGGKASTTVKERSLDELFQYIAATNMSVAVPRGSVIVLYSLASTLDYIQALTTKRALGHIEPHEVALLRYVVNRATNAFERAGVGNWDDLAASIVTTTPPELWRTTDGRPVTSGDRLTFLRSLVDQWFDYWILLKHALPYNWIYGDRCDDGKRC